MCCPIFICSHKYGKIKNFILFVEQVQKNCHIALIFRIPDPGVKKASHPRSGSLRTYELAFPVFQ